MSILTVVSPDKQPLLLGGVQKLPSLTEKRHLDHSQHLGNPKSSQSPEPGTVDEEEQIYQHMGPSQQYSHTSQKMLAHYQNLIQSLIIIQSIIMSYDDISQGEDTQVFSPPSELLRFQKQKWSQENMVAPLEASSIMELRDNIISYSETLSRY